MKPLDIAAAVLVAAVWGVNFVAARILLADLPPLLTVALRFALVGILLAPFVALPRYRFRRIALLSATFGTLHFGTMFTGLQQIEAGTAAILAQLQVPFTELLAIVMLREHPPLRRIGGMLLAFAGVLLLFGEPRIGEHIGHALLIVFAALVWSVANFQMKAVTGIGGPSLNAWVSLFAAPQLLALSLLVEDGQRSGIQSAGVAAWAAMAYMVVAVTMIGYGLWYRLIRRYSVSQTVPFTLLVPVFGVTAGVVVLGEPMSWQITAGGILTVAGTALIVLRRSAAPG